MIPLTQKEASKYLGIGVDRLIALRSFGLAPLPGVDKYEKSQLDQFVQFLINEQAKGWTLPSDEAGERESGLRILSDKPRRGPRRSKPKGVGDTVHPLDRTNVA